MYLDFVLVKPHKEDWIDLLYDLLQEVYVTSALAFKNFEILCPAVAPFNAFFREKEKKKFPLKSVLNTLFNLFTIHRCNELCDREAS